MKIDNTNSQAMVPFYPSHDFVNESLITFMNYLYDLFTDSLKFGNYVLVMNIHLELKACANAQDCWE